MFANLSQHFAEIAALILFGIGFTNLLLNRNMMKKIIGFSMLDSAIYLFCCIIVYVWLCYVCRQLSFWIGKRAVTK